MENMEEIEIMKDMEGMEEVADPVVPIKNTTFINFYKNIDNTTLDKWDVEFTINQEILYNILNYISDINTDFIIKFYKNRIFIQLKSPDNIQYTEINIASNALGEYKPGLEGYKNLHYDPIFDDDNIGKVIENAKGDEYKAVIVDFKGIMTNIKFVIEKDDFVVIRIDTLDTGTGIMEMIFPGGIKFWTQTIYCIQKHTIKKSLEKLPYIIKRGRIDPKIHSAKVKLEPKTFAKMCATFRFTGKARDIDKRIYIKLGKQGLDIISGDKLVGRLFQVKNIDDSITDTLENIDLANEEDIDNAIIKMENELNTHGKEKKKGKTEKIGAVLDLLYDLVVDSDQIVYIVSDYILPFLRLKGLTPIILEIRGDKPIVLQQTLCPGIDILLSVAPRIESEND